MLADRMVLSGNERRDRVEPTPSRLDIFISLAFILLLGIQIASWFAVDAYDASLSRFGLAGFWISQFLSLYLALGLFRRGRLYFRPLILVLLFFIYLFIVILLTSPETSLKAMSASRFGIVSWFIIGLGCAGMIDILRDARSSRRGNASRIALVANCLLIVAILIPDVAVYLANPQPTPNYQIAANQFIILATMLALAIEALWGVKKPRTLMFGFIVIGSFCAMAVIAMQSTSIVFLWIALVAIFIGGTVIRSNFLNSASISIMVAICIYLLITSDFSYDLIMSTRFSPILSGFDEFSSFSTRLNIFYYFWDQFSVSPIFGNFRAEIASGSGEGNYIHSLPLSFLTHSGVVGFILISIIISVLIGGRIMYRDVDSTDTHLSGYTLSFFFLGTIACFMTWSVFWFMLGLLCLRPMIPSYGR